MCSKFKNVTLLGPYVADYGKGVFCQLGLCSDFGSLWVFTKLSFCQLAKLRGVFKNVTLLGPYVADYGRGVCVCPLSVGLCSDFGSLWVFMKLSFCQLAKLRGVFNSLLSVCS